MAKVDASKLWFTLFTDLADTALMSLLVMWTLPYFGSHPGYWVCWLVVLTVSGLIASGVKTAMTLIKTRE